MLKHAAKSLLAASLLAAGAAQATVVQYGDDLIFTYDETTQYGLGTVVGNNIYFSPTEFIAESANTEGAVTALETLNIQIQVVNPSSGFRITGFEVAELGDYRLNGSSSSVSAEGRLQVTSNTTNCGGGLFPACTDAEIFSAGALTTTGALTEWSTYADIDLDDTIGWGEDTNVNVQIQNDLIATSVVEGELAFIQKKAQGVGIVVVSEIPLPAAGWLFGSALLTLIARRKSA